MMMCSILLLPFLSQTSQAAERTFLADECLATAMIAPQVVQTRNRGQYKTATMADLWDNIWMAAVSPDRPFACHFRKCYNVIPETRGVKPGI
jgi:hypothetical protein